MNDGLTIQQQLALEMKYRALSMAENTSDALDRKLTTLMGSGGLVLAATGLVYSKTAVHPTYQLVISLLVIMGLLSLLMLLLLTLHVWRPMPFRALGSHDWDTVQVEIVKQESASKAYNQVLAECLAAIQAAEAVNSDKASVVKIGVSLLAAQSTLISIAIAMTFAARIP